MVSTFAPVLNHLVTLSCELSVKDAKLTHSAYIHTVGEFSGVFDARIY